MASKRSGDTTASRLSTLGTKSHRFDGTSAPKMADAPRVPGPPMKMRRKKSKGEELPAVGSEFRHDSATSQESGVRDSRRRWSRPSPSGDVSISSRYRLGGGVLPVIRQFALALEGFERSQGAGLFHDRFIKSQGRVSSHLRTPTPPGKAARLRYNSDFDSGCWANAARAVAVGSGVKIHQDARSCENRFRKETFTLPSLQIGRPRERT